MSLALQIAVKRLEERVALLEHVLGRLPQAEYKAGGEIMRPVDIKRGFRKFLVIDAADNLVAEYPSKAEAEAKRDEINNHRASAA